MVLSQQEIEKAHDAFEKFDVDHSGCIDAWELKEAMKSLGQNPTDEEVFGLLAQVDTDGSGNIDFQEFLQVIEKQRDSQGDTGEDWDMVSAFVALGGNADKSGEIDIDKLRDMINKFELTIDIEGLIEETDKDGSGLIDYGEFKAMLS
ncbi:MAG: EF-hand domain-containing protein [Promethearchaeia archaeon]|jgi:calmodulin